MDQRRDADNPLHRFAVADRGDVFGGRDLFLENRSIATSENKLSSAWSCVLPQNKAASTAKENR
ncbi:hypothetical protein RMSM_00641 [Rhodopirellula maiorica SM1]|uniref:Uncharacterized protein n=1 Tax=Rhodopirellula maiorica SM1 TaxID=1265738 RepID=M5RTB3_9BACT|nr:hypothetical protein RMSM_00641 [Rhodopirellula maiorica SM1]